jgi:hypothetical protein
VIGGTQHDLCRGCFDELHPNGKPEESAGGLESCCNCGTKTADGISVYAEPDKFTHPSPFSKVALGEPANSIEDLFTW